MSIGTRRAPEEACTLACDAHHSLARLVGRFKRPGFADCTTFQLTLGETPEDRPATGLRRQRACPFGEQLRVSCSSGPIYARYMPWPTFLTMFSSGRVLLTALARSLALDL